MKYLSNKHCIIVINKHKNSENNSVAKKAAKQCCAPIISS